MSYALSPRPELGPDETAALVAVAQELLRESNETVVTIDETPIWRFSGRWFAGGPLVMRRPHGFN